MDEKGKELIADIAVDEGIIQVEDGNTAFRWVKQEAPMQSAPGLAQVVREQVFFGCAESKHGFSGVIGRIL
jgi:hypothetical protein